MDSRNPSLCHMVCAEGEVVKELGYRPNNELIKNTFTAEAPKQRETRLRQSGSVK